MVQKGYIVTGDECDIKFRNLKETYKRIKENNSETGRGTITWPYFDQFDSIFAFSYAVQPLATASNTKGYMSRPSTSTDTVPTYKDISDDTISSPVPTKKRRVASNNEVEPAWMTEFRRDQQERQ
ncbi:Myb/SANT-like DNA-binding domain [Popillia japonica]|uniref:Myb/SANT-like DNA-binding domain n=1 Tax=Popillia japonica TaxID=7064 RepID=A0AAW1JII2_POPJA